MPSILNDVELKEKLNELNGWETNGKEISKEYELKDFTSAMGLITKIGIQAEKMDHHPDILIHSWNKVKVTLSTHSEGGITENDTKLAGFIENYV